MKICPFISHMIGEDRANILQADTPIKGRKSGSKSKAKSKAKSKSKKARTQSETSPLFCLQETCRFYQSKDATCMFDNMFEMAEKQESWMAGRDDEASKAAAAPMDELLDQVSKELEKFWKFQTKSVAELISSVGESEKKQSESLAEFKKCIEQPVDTEEMKKLSTNVVGLQDSLKSREESIENLSTTVSEMIVNIEDGLSKLREESGQLSERIAELERSTPKVGTIEDLLEAKWIDATTNRPSQDTSEINDVVSALESLVESNRQLQENLNTWKDGFESRFIEIQERQQSWSERIDHITDSQERVMGLIEQGRKQIEEDSDRIRRREARKFNNLGVTSFHNGALELARDQFLEAVRLDGTFAESFNNLGLVYTELGDEDEATHAFNRAIELDPDLNAAYNNLGYVFYKQGNYEQAVEMYNQALGRSSDNSSAYTNLGNAYFKQGNLEAAKDAWEKALEIDPGNERASRSLKRLEQTV